MSASKAPPKDPPQDAAAPPASAPPTLWVKVLSGRPYGGPEVGTKLELPVDEARMRVDLGQAELTTPPATEG
jgi:hypothetical protein